MTSPSQLQSAVTGTASQAELQQSEGAGAQEVGAQVTAGWQVVTQAVFSLLRFLNRQRRPLPAQAGLNDSRTASVATVKQRIQYGNNFDMSNFPVFGRAQRRDLSGRHQNMLVA